jgi:hypothetical protein
MGIDTSLFHGLSTKAPNRAESTENPGGIKILEMKGVSPHAWIFDWTISRPDHFQRADF